MLRLIKKIMRLDLYLFENNYAMSRTEAKNFILNGKVTVNGISVKKPSYELTDDTAEIRVEKDAKKYVSRGGFKLECAINSFSFEICGKVALDIGASSGGFTDCLLKNGASKVIAVDSGSGQMAPSLRMDDRVTVIEKYNARYMKPEDFEFVPDLAVMDVSFISATHIIPAVYNCLKNDGDFICLIKPQFEVGKNNIGKGGIVKSESARIAAVDKVVAFAKMTGFACLGTVKSDITGGDGNIEYLAHFKKRAEGEL